jgi:hypothetical protein
MEIVYVDRKVLVKRHLVFQLENVQLQIPAAQILGLETEIIARDRLHAEHGLVEFH